MSNPNVSSLLSRYETLCQRQLELGIEMAEVRAKILAAAPPTKKRSRSTNVELAEALKSTVKVLREADGPLPRREIASRLGVSGSAAGFRLAQAVKAGFAVKLNHGRYACAAVVPATL